MINSLMDALGAGAVVNRRLHGKSRSGHTGVLVAPADCLWSADMYPVLRTRNAGPGNVYLFQWLLLSEGCQGHWACRLNPVDLRRQADSAKLTTLPYSHPSPNSAPSSATWTTWTGASGATSAAKRKLIALLRGGEAGCRQPGRHPRPRPQRPPQALRRRVARRRAGALGTVAARGKYRLIQTGITLGRELCRYGTQMSIQLTLRRRPTDVQSGRLNLTST